MGEHELADTARAQLGLVGRHQARAHLTRKQLESRLASGQLLVVRRGVYRYAGAPDTRWQAQLAACLAAGPGAVASHWAAAAVWGLPGVVSHCPEVLVPWPMWVRLPGVRSHQSSILPTSHCTVAEAVPVTTAARTAADLAGQVSPRLLGRLVDAALRRRLATVSGLWRVHDDLSGSRHRGVVALRAVLDLRGEGYRPGDSDPEVALVKALVDAGLPPPVMQYQVVIGGSVYVLDIAYPDRRIDIEYDGWEAHASRSAFDHDRARANALAAAGWRVIHVTSAMDTESVVAIVRSLRERTPCEV